MNSIPMQTRNLSTLPQCWLFGSHKYYYMESGKRKQLLPTLKLEYEQVLLDLGIPFRQTIDGTEYEYWQPGNYEEKKITLPLYRKITDEEYKFVKYYNDKIITDSTSQAAFSLVEQVSQKITEFEKNKKKEKLVHDLKCMLDGREAIGVDHTANPLESNYDKELDLISGEDHIRVFPVYALMSEEKMQSWEDYLSDLLFMDDDIDYNPYLSTNYVAIFDMKKIKENVVAELEAPHGKEGLYVGRKGWQVKEWSEKLGIKKINVIGSK